MWECHFKNLKSGEIFTKVFDSPYLMDQMLRKVKYSKKIIYLGRTKVWG